MAFLTVNIDTRAVVAELKGIRAAQESTARIMAEILEAVKSQPDPGEREASPELVELVELTGGTARASRNLADRLKPLTE